MALKAHISWVGDRTFLGRSGSSHSVIMDVDADSGGHDAGVRPLEMLLLGMGGCARPMTSSTSCKKAVSRLRAVPSSWRPNGLTRSLVCLPGFRSNTGLPPLNVFLLTVRFYAAFHIFPPMPCGIYSHSSPFGT